EMTWPAVLVIEIMMLLNVALMCAWPTASTFTTLFFALSLRLSPAITNIRFYCIVLTLGCFLLICYRLAVILTGPRVVLGRLAPNRQSFSVAQAAIAADVHEALDAQLALRLEHTFDLVLLRNDSPNGIGFIVRPILHLFVPIQVGFRKDLLGRPSADAENVGKSDLTSLVIRNVDRKSTRLNSSHVKISYAVFC